MIDEWLLADREAPRKQRHTAKRVWERLVSERIDEALSLEWRDVDLARGTSR